MHHKPVSLEVFTVNKCQRVWPWSVTQDKYRKYESKGQRQVCHSASSTDFGEERWSIRLKVGVKYSWRPVEVGPRFLNTFPVGLSLYKSLFLKEKIYTVMKAMVKIIRSTFVSFPARRSRTVQVCSFCPLQATHATAPHEQVLFFVLVQVSTKAHA